MAGEGWGEGINVQVLHLTIMRLAGLVQKPSGCPDSLKRGELVTFFQIHAGLGWLSMESDENDFEHGTLVFPRLRSG